MKRKKLTAKQNRAMRLSTAPYMGESAWLSENHAWELFHKASGYTLVNWQPCRNTSMVAYRLDTAWVLRMRDGKESIIPAYVQRAVVDRCLGVILDMNGKRIA